MDTLIKTLCIVLGITLVLTCAWLALTTPLGQFVYVVAAAELFGAFSFFYGVCYEA